MERSTRPPLVDELAAFDRLLEIGVGSRPNVARALAADGCDVVVVDVDPAVVDGVGSDPVGSATERSATVDGWLVARRADVHDLAANADPLASLRLPRESAGGVDVVYARNLPAELQSPTVDVARRLDAACLFTTLGFEEPVVDVDRRSLSDGTLYVARR